MHKIREDFTGPWQTLFAQHHYTGFDAFWHATLQSVDEPNIGRGGRSEVGRLELTAADGGKRVFFVKRQVNYTRRTLRHPLRGTPLTLKEFNNIRTFEKIGIPCLEACYQGYRYQAGELQSVLVTPELTGYRDLDHYQPASISESRRITRELAHIVARIHQAGLRYGCLYPKHIFVNPQNREAPVRLIDLEKVSARPLRPVNRLRDLYTLQRRVNGNRSSHLYFLLCYFHLNKHNDQIRRFIRKLEARKSRRRQATATSQPEKTCAGR